MRKLVYRGVVSGIVTEYGSPVNTGTETLEPITLTATETSAENMINTPKKMLYNLTKYETQLATKICKIFSHVYMIQQQRNTWHLQLHASIYKTLNFPSKNAL